MTSFGPTMLADDVGDFPVDHDDAGDEIGSWLTLVDKQPLLVLDRR